jgi:hypothetical protein
VPTRGDVGTGFSSDVSAIAPARYLQLSGYRECRAPEFLRFIIEISARHSPLLGPSRLFRWLALFSRSGLGGFLWCFRPAADKYDHDFLLFEILFMLGGNRINYQQAQGGQRRGAIARQRRA